MATIRKHMGYYLSLCIMLVLGIILVQQTAYNRQLQTAIAVMVIALYLAWTLLHHRIHHGLTAKIMLEYILIGSLALSVLLFLSQGAS